MQRGACEAIVCEMPPRWQASAAQAQLPGFFFLIKEQRSQNFNKRQKHVSCKLHHKVPFTQRLPCFREKGAGPQKDSRSGAIITSCFPMESRRFRKVIPGFAGEERKRKSKLVYMVQRCVHDGCRGMGGSESRDESAAPGHLITRQTHSEPQGRSE